MCNYNFLNVKPIMSIGFQSCVYNYQYDKSIAHFKNCFDPWCFAYFKYVLFLTFYLILTIEIEIGKKN
ncbi:unnamed protein product [Brugia pahangi]|uniref:Uncharacterized protein n=1 Tax=Brugia pahangi TaxID=6280 RepID=A0A0N4TX40_BRUPA|nr:unnamed protein product [Brugia pahangi]